MRLAWKHLLEGVHLLAVLRRPISKNKAFRMTKVIQAAKIYNAEGSLAAASSRAPRAEQPATSQAQQGGVSRGFAAEANL